MPFQDHSVSGLTYSLQNVHLAHDFPWPVPVPLKAVELDVKVVNFTAEVKVTQRFVNCERAAIECVYFFPVEEEAAVTDFTARLEGRTIKTVIKEKAEARADYNKAVEDNQSAVLLEETKQDIFEIRVGQLSPGASCVVTLTFLMELPVEDKRTKLTVPTTVAPRYIPPQDDSAIAKKISSIQHDFNSPVKMSLSLQVVMQTEILSVTSPSHPLKVTDKTKHNGYHVHTVKLEVNTALDRDLIVFIDSDQPCQPKVMIERNHENSLVAMLTLVPDFKIRDHPIEAVFLVDCSGSMAGQSMNLARESLLVFLHSLPTTSYFNIIIFGSNFQSLFPDSRRYDDENLREAKTSCDGISANMGGTEVYTPLRHILQQPVKAGLARQVFILTDGQVSNSADCIELVRQHSNNNRVFTLGIGSSADRQLVKGLARAGGGTSMFTSQGEKITPKVMSQLRNALQPGITDVRVRWPNSDTFEGHGNMNVEIETKKTLFGYGKPKQKTKFSVKSQIPTKIPPIYDGSRLVVYKLLEQNVTGNPELILKARTCEGDLEVVLPVTTESFIQGNSLHQLFARKMIQELEEKHHHDLDEARTVITELGLKYNLASKFTSFVGVDDKQNLSWSGIMRTRQVSNQMPAGYMAHRWRAKAAPCSPSFGFPLGGGGGIMHQNELCGLGPPPTSSTQFEGPLAPGCSAAAGMITGPPSPSWSALSRGYKAPGGPLYRSRGSSSESEECLETFDSRSLFQPFENQSVNKQSGFGLLSTEQDSVKSLKSDSSSLRLTLSQNADGSFPADASTAAILGCDFHQMINAGQSMDPLVWVTVVCLVYLEEKCEADRESWELVAEKAAKWLLTRGVVMAGSLEQRARLLVTGRGGVGM